MKYLMGVDEGTTGCKAILFTDEGTQIASTAREYPSYYPNPGWVEQDIYEIKKAVFECIEETIVKSNVNPSDIVGISHSNQGITMVLLDENEQPVFEHTIGWQDLRYVDILPELMKEVDQKEYLKISGMQYGTYNIPVLRWLQINEKEKWSKVKRICSHQDWFLRQYGADGYYIDEGCANFLSMVRMSDNEWDERLLKYYNVTEDMLPKVVHIPGTVVGNVSEEVSKATGLPVTCKVCLGNLDANSCAIGSGADEIGTQLLIMGTAGVSIFVTDKDKLDPNGRITVRTNPGFGNWQNYIMTNTGASAFRWFRDSICSMEVATSKLMGMDPYDIITTIASHSKPGANGVTALTCIQGSHTRKKNEKARGSFFGINLGTTKADLAESILEGICFEMKDIMAMNQELSGEVTHVRLCGGVAKSPMWCQMSDFLNECGNDYAFCSNGKFVKVFFKRTPEPIVLDIFPIDYYNDDISFEQLQNIDMQLKKEFDSNTDKSAVKRDKWYKAIRSSGKIVSKMESSHLCYGLETDFIKMCNSYFSLNYVLPLKKINFENKVFLGPGNPDKMLEMEYGDYMQWPNDAGSTAHGANRRFSRYKNYSNPRYIHTKSEAEDFCKEINEKAGDYQLIVEKYKIFNWKEYFDIVDYLDEYDISYIVYA